MGKPERHETIRAVIRRNDVSTQDQLQDLLRVEGCEVVQSTLSRDLREIGVTKERGTYRLLREHPDRPEAAEELATRLSQAVLRVDSGGTVVTLKLRPGAEPDEVAREIESAGLPSVVAAVGCSGTVLVIVRTAAYAHDLVRALQPAVRFVRRP